MSLPMYMKEPGEHELVIIQGSQDMEDNPMDPSTIVMPRLEETDSESMGHSRHDSHSSSAVYVDLPDPHHVQTPLLQGDDESHDHDHEHDRNQGHHDPEHDPTNTSSQAAQDNEADNSRDPLIPPGQNASSDPRGEAPPYFEVVANDSQNDLSRMQSPGGDSTSPSSPLTEEGGLAGQQLPASGSSRRRSVLRGILNAATSALNPRTPMSMPGRSSRDGARSPGAVVSLDGDAPVGRPSGGGARPSTSVPRPSTATRHRPSHSGTGSMLSIASSGLRPLSRTRTRSTSKFAFAQQSRGHLTSPSALSINSISSPLTHTLVRTDFVYPKTGPTPEQLKLLSSREAVGRYGVPYGPDALAYVASTSRLDLHGPPPDFESHVGGGSGAGTESRPSIDGLPVAGMSALRSRSRLGLNPDEPSSGSPSPEPPSLETAGTPAADAREDAVEGSPEAEIVPELPSPPLEDSTSSEKGLHAAEPTVTAGHGHEQEATITPATLHTDNGAEVAAAEVTSAADIPIDQNPSVPSTTASPPSSPPSSLTPSPTLLPTTAPPVTTVPTKASPPVTKLSAPPTAFHMSPSNGAPGARAESRASSYMSYATAQEGLTDTETPTTPGFRTESPEDKDSANNEDDDDGDSAPPTPRISRAPFVAGVGKEVGAVVAG
ncbi:hypothetical protein HETIRDRAFT_479927 [Heterobasidion irregulare TC 32-1]|uniref:Uncharacterized protein n=1 Tax=Heterobasidion irregulare (strain TC 32-1) TaxID=747525 RepID=W4JUV7_HETIT|nr:uncharacterized protein HETIRDRAFT_479927 [Heterobasidion irregulare TC 32-1]ETW77307.1 hypothetical protein HETIRDRAFT_479927 [Heterobasidion irregulare TC 32-1]